jgi:hypothetical protein
MKEIDPTEINIRWHKAKDKMKGKAADSKGIRQTDI